MSDGSASLTGPGEAVLGRFPPPRGADLESLTALYRQWCRQVPFDNALRYLALARGADAEHPGIEPADFWRDWLDFGCGGTCLSTARALGTVLVAHGYRIEHVLAHIDDAPEPDHVTTVVELPEGPFLVDTVGLVEDPVPLRRHHVPEAGHALGASSWPTADGWSVRWRTPVHRTAQSCHVLRGTVVGDPRSFATRTQESSTFRSFNRQLYARTNLRGGVVVVMGPFVTEVSPDGVVTSSPRHGTTVLRDDFGWDQALIDSLEEAGAFG